MKKYTLLVFLGLLTGCDSPSSCTKEHAAMFFVNYQSAVYNRHIDWSLSYIINNYIISIEKTGVVDSRYGTPVCKTKIKNDTYGFLPMHDEKPFATACFAYVPTTGEYKIVTGLRGCCNPYFVNAENEFCHF